ncbi:MAG: hypothetical protein A2020_03875 [Lentisphaerae bacterium GWF2_45_14]|nr:MAG: hypothetical protein A2020_03875 [Lentisphaerae bacterium GWF2_45_14]
MSASKILAGIRIDGKLTGNADIKIEGEIYGEVNLDSSIFIAEGGKAEAKIKAINIFLAGTFIGDAEADFIQITPTGRVNGKLKAPAISIEKGAKFTGSIEMGEGEAPSSETSAEAISESADIESPDGEEIIDDPESSEIGILKSSIIDSTIKHHAPFLPGRAIDPESEEN